MIDILILNFSLITGRTEKFKSFFSFLKIPSIVHRDTLKESSDIPREELVPLFVNLKICCKKNKRSIT